MAVEEVTPHKHIRVRPEKPTPQEILRAAELVIRVNGWSKTPDTTKYTLHEAINKVAEEVTGAGKSGGAARPYRDEANELLVQKVGKNDMEINDQATNVNDVYAAIDKAVS